MLFSSPLETLSYCPRITTLRPEVTKSVAEAPLSLSTLLMIIFGASPKISFPDPVIVIRAFLMPSDGSKLNVIGLAPTGSVLSQLPYPS